MCPVEQKEFDRMIKLAEKIGFNDEELAELMVTYGCRDKAAR